MDIYFPKISAFYLLRKILFFIPKNSNINDLITNGFDNYFLDSVENKPEKEVTKNQIIALSKIFVPEILPTASFEEIIKTILSGEFLFKRNISRYENLITEMEYFMSLNNKNISFIKQNLPIEETEFNLYNLQFNYFQCLNYLYQLFDLLQFNSGIKESSYKYYYAEQMTKFTTNSINTRHLENFLLKILDPEIKLYTLDDLKENYSYPADYKYPRDI